LEAKYPGTKWSKLPEGTFIRAAGTAAGGTGGSASVTLTVSQIPSHLHEGTLSGKGSGAQYGEIYVAAGSATRALGSPASANIATPLAGGGLSHENRPPYKDYYVYERLT
jgi:microcystin-dependent protein